MKPKPREIWQRLVAEAAPQHLPPTDEAVSRIVSSLRWRQAQASGPPRELLWELISRFALPGAVALLLLTVLVPSPNDSSPAESVDDLIAAAIELP